MALLEQGAKLLASDGEANDWFGYSVALAGDYALVGAPQSHFNHNSEGSGSTYVFVRSGSSWMEDAKLLASDGAANDKLGRSVALSGNSALVGATPAVDDDNGACLLQRDDVAREAGLVGHAVTTVLDDDELGGGRLERDGAARKQECVRQPRRTHAGSH